MTLCKTEVNAGRHLEKGEDVLEMPSSLEIYFSKATIQMVVGNIEIALNGIICIVERRSGNSHLNKM